MYETTEKPWGGINTFFRNFIKVADKSACINIVSDYKKADIVLTAGHSFSAKKSKGDDELKRIFEYRNRVQRFSFLWRGRKLPKIVFRVDGLRLFYSGVFSSQDKMLIDNLNNADAVVFQSEFSKDCFRKKLKRSYSCEQIILNGADRNIFFPSSGLSERKKIKIVSCSWSVNLKKGFEKIFLFSKIPNVEVSHIGRWPKSVPKGDIGFLGSLDEKSIGEAMRQNHLLIFPSINEACPNTVVEALSCGLPVLYHNSGGTVELCKNELYGWRLPDINSVEELAFFLKNVMKGYSIVRENIMKDTDIFSFERCFDSYITFFEKVIDS